MRLTGNPNQWWDYHPAESILREDIPKKQLYVIESEGIIGGVFAYIQGADPTYLEIEGGSWLNDEPYGVIHRIASDGSGGILKAAVEFAAGHVDYLRIDTHADNHVMQKAVRKQGFRYCGIIYIADGTPRLAYDRK